MSVVAAAVLGSAALGAYSSNQASKAASKSADKIAAQGDASVQLGRDQFDWFKGEYERTAPEREATTARSNAVSDAQLEGMKFATDEAKRLSERNRTVFQPLEDQVVADSQTFDTQARRDQSVAEAAAGVENSVGRAQQGAARSMLRLGMSPTGSASSALMQDAALSKAKMLAGATADATRNVEAQGYARKMDAVGLGRGVIGNQGTQQQIASSTGNSAVSSSNSALNAATSGGRIMETGFNGAMSGFNQGASIYGQAGKFDQIAAAQQQDAISQIGGALGYVFRSDERLKMNTGKRTDGRRELAEVNATTVDQDWQYDPAKGGPDDGGRDHTGPMAQTVRATMGEKAAPGGEVIDMREVGGKLIASVQALSKDVTKLKRRISRMSA